MPWLQCLIRGENFVDVEGRAFGFYTTRFVETESAAEAEMSCLANLKAEKSLDAFKGFSPDARVNFEEIAELACKPHRKAQGFTFYPMTDEDS